MRTNRLAAIGSAILAMPAMAQGETPYEQAVLTALNGVRANPVLYVDQLRQYRGYLHGNVAVFPGSAVRHLTKEGSRPVDEAISYLSSAPGLPPMSASPLLAKAAAEHVREQARTGAVGHDDQAHLMPEDRIYANGGKGVVAEVIAYGASDPSGVVRQLIVDDGVPDRGHRTVLFASALRYAGVSCGSHPIFRTMCVIDFAQAVDSAPYPIAVVIAKAENSELRNSMHRVVDNLALKERLSRARHRLKSFVEPDRPATK